MGAMLVRERYKVVWVLDAREDYAFAEAVDDTFALVVRRADGSREAVSSGEVSVRGLLGYV